MKRALCSLTFAALLVCNTSASAAPLPGASPEKLDASQALAYENFKDIEFNTVTRVQDLELPNGTTVSLRLERFTVRAAGARVIAVDRFGEEHDIGDNGLRMFQGTIDTDPDSIVFIASSPYFTHGYIQGTKDLYSISSGKAVTDPNAQPNPITIVNTDNVVFENEAPFPCGVDPVFDNYPELAANITFEPENPLPQEREIQCRLVSIALDTDFEYTDRLFNGDTNASSAYAETLLGAISTIYEDNVETTLVTNFVRVFKNNNDPYTDSGDALDQVQTHWRAQQTNVERHLVHYLTGRRNLSYGGVAYLSALCDPNQGFGVSAYLNGTFPQPVTSQVGGNWDIVVMAHELGHNHGTGHTHDSYVPTIDDCGNGDCALAYKGTIMSYCHTCSGGISNIRLKFHARVRITMKFYLGTIPNCDIVNPDWVSDAMAIDDYAETLSGKRILIDVLDNDTSGSCSGYRPVINTFDSFSTNGGAISIQKIRNSNNNGFYYIPPSQTFTGTDTFDYTNSWGDPATVTVEVLPFRPPDILESTVAGVTAEYFSFSSGPALTEIPNLTGLTPDSTELMSEINYAPAAGPFAGSGLTDRFAARITGYIVAPQTMVHTFYLDSDDGSRLTIGGLEIIDHDGNHGYTELSGDIPLQQGPHPFVLEYYDNDGDAGLTLSFSAYGSSKILVNSNMLVSAPDPVACSPDINGDGVVDNGDISAFISLFLSGDIAADFTGDGILDNGDIGAFIEAFIAGC